MLMSKPEMMGDQEYLDRRYEWDINIRIGDKEENGYIALSITILNRAIIPFQKTIYISVGWNQ